MLNILILHYKTNRINIIENTNNEDNLDNNHINNVSVNLENNNFSNLFRRPYNIEQNDRNLNNIVNPNMHNRNDIKCAICIWKTLKREKYLKFTVQSYFSYPLLK